MIKFLLHPAAYMLLLVSCFCMAEDENWRNRPSSNIEFTEEDIAAEISFGREIAARIFGKHPAYDNPELTRYVTLVGNSLALGANRPELEFYFSILDTDELNSYAAPGGYVFISKGSLKMMRDESELAGVLAYQIAHIVDKHIVRQLNLKGSGIPPSLALLIGGTSTALRAALQATTPVPSIRHSDFTINSGLELIYSNTYKTEDKIQSANTALTLSAMSGYDPKGHVRYLERIKQSISSAPDRSANLPIELHSQIDQLQRSFTEEGFGNINFVKDAIRFTETMKSLK